MRKQSIKIQETLVYCLAVLLAISLLIPVLLEARPRLQEPTLPEEQFKLAKKYFNGDGVPQDYSEALRWYLVAAVRGHAVAQSNLGVMYANGRGVPQDYIRAHKWFSLSAATGNKEAARRRDVTAKRLTARQLGEAQRLARVWWDNHKKQ